MWKDWKFWAGIVLTVIFLGYFLQGMSFFGVPANTKIPVYVTWDQESFYVDIKGKKLAAVDRPEEGQDPESRPEEEAPLPAEVGWHADYPGELTEGQYSGTFTFTHLAGGISSLAAKDLLDDIKASDIDSLDTQFAYDEMDVATGRGSQVDSPVLATNAETSAFLSMELEYDQQESTPGATFYIGNTAGDGILLVFSAEWSSASAHRIRDGAFIGDELGRVSGVVPALQQANYWWLIPATLLLYLSIVFRAFRWRIFFGEYNKVPIQRHFGMIAIGFAGNAVLPLRAGEFIRAWLGARENECTFSLSLGTLVMARLFDMIAMLASLVTVLALANFPVVNEATVKNLQMAGWLMMIPLVGGIAFLFVMTFQRAVALKIVRLCTFFLPHGLREKILAMAESFAEGLTTLRSPTKILWCLFHSVGVWLTIAVSEYCIMLAFGLDQVGLIGSAFVMVVICFAIAAPSSPGYVGLFHAAIKFALMEFYGVAANVAMGVAIILHAHQMLSIIIAGFISMLLMGVSFKQVKAHSHDVEEEIEEDLETAKP